MGMTTLCVEFGAFPSIAGRPHPFRWVLIPWLCAREAAVEIELVRAPCRIDQVDHLSAMTVAIA